MRGWARAFTTLIGAAAAGALVWFVPHFDRWSTGGYFGGMAIFALAGLLLGVAQLRGREGNPVAFFLTVFVPALIAVGWVTLAAQPRSSWLRDHVVSWSGDIGIGHAVHNLGEHVAVLVFGLGLIFGLTFEPAMIRRRSKAAAAPSPPPSPPPIHTVPATSAPEEPTMVDVPEHDTAVVEPAGTLEPTVVTTAGTERAEPTLVSSSEHDTVVVEPSDGRPPASDETPRPDEPTPPGVPS